MLTAKLTKQNQENARNMGGDKETVSRYVVVGINGKGEITKGVDCRVYMGRSRNASTVYASIWVHSSGVWPSGHGNAGGYGYHKESAAIDEAIRSAGITLYGDVYGREETQKKAYINGVGDSAVREALLAIGRDIVGLKNCKVV